MGCNISHRRFLHSKHHYCGWRKAFNEDIKQRKAPPALSGDQIFEKVKDVRNQFGKPFVHTVVKGGWKKRSICFELPYWKSLYVRHFLDVMHIEKMYLKVLLVHYSILKESLRMALKQGRTC